MSHSISTLLTRNLHDVFGENDPRVGARPSTSSSPKIACSTTPAGRLSGAKRTWLERAVMSANDPKQTLLTTGR